MESNLGFQNQNLLYFCVLKKRPRPELQTHLFTSAWPLPAHQGCYGEVWEHFIPLSLAASQKHLQVSSRISLFYKHLPKQIIIACVHISGIQVSKQPRASSLQNLKFFTGLGRCQQ